jgi:hypothetical protein
MLIESRVEAGTLYIDAEAAGGIDKSVLAGEFDPDRVLENVVGVVGLIAGKLSEAAGQASVSMLAPSRIEIRFAVRVDANSVVSVSRDASGGQFQVMVEWTPGR